MSYAIATFDRARRPARGRGMMLAVKALLLSLTVLFAQSAAADPARAAQVLQSAQINYTIMKMQLETGKQFARSFRFQDASTAYNQANFTAAIMSTDIIRLRQENIDTFQRGLYVDGASQERAITYNRRAEAQMALLQSHLRVLGASPSSSPASVDMALLMFDIEFDLTKRMMAAAQ